MVHNPPEETLLKSSYEAMFALNDNSSRKKTTFLQHGNSFPVTLNSNVCLPCHIFPLKLVQSNLRMNTKHFHVHSEVDQNAIATLLRSLNAGNFGAAFKGSNNQPSCYFLSEYLFYIKID